MLPVCNDRASVLELLEGLRIDPEPASSLRLVRLMGGRGALSRTALEASPQWRQAHELLARTAAAPDTDPGRRN